MTNDYVFESPADPTIDLTVELQKAYQSATHAYANKTLHGGDDWAALQGINTRYEAEKEDLEQRYVETFDERITAKIADLYHDANEFNLPPPSPTGGGQTNDEIATEADRLVRQDHENDREALNSARQSAIESLLDTAQGRNQAQGVARDGFTRATDRRTCPDRRGPRQSQN